MILRSLFGVLIILLPLGLKSQNTPVPVRVTCKDFNGNMLKGEQIWFQDVDTKKIFKAVTNDKGIFDMEIEGPGTYMIMIKSIGDAEDYTQFTVPELKEGQIYGTYNITVEMEPAKVFTLDRVFFESGKATLKQESYAELKELHEFMTNKKTATIEIGGHTDNVGSDESNQKLSQERAEAVKSYLVKNGIAGNRISAIGYGESLPIANNDDEIGRAKNRRTEVKILSE